MRFSIEEEMRTRYGLVMRRTALFVVLFSSIFSGHQTLAACRHPSVLFVPSGITSKSILLDKNDMCKFSFGMGAKITGFSIVVRPKNGTIGRAEQTGDNLDVAYKPKPNFVGQDRFEADVDYLFPVLGTPLKTRLVYSIVVK